MARRQFDQQSYFRGVPTAPYDLIKEISIATAAMLVVVLVLAFVLSSPDAPPVTIQSWSHAAPLDFLETATTELQGTSFTADYGPPYNGGTGHIQTLGPLKPQIWAGIHQPVDPPQADVITPLKLASVGRAGLTTALNQYRNASTTQQQSWLTAYAKLLPRATVSGPLVTVGQGADGPLNTMMEALLADARAGALDSLLMHSGQFFDTNYTQPLLFLGDGTYFANLASKLRLNGSQWGMMNETGRYPGQSWLWLYTLWYQVPPFSTAKNADLLVVLMMGLLSTLLLFVPLIPGLRDLPRWLGLHRLVWREHYRFVRETTSHTQSPE
ncbi:MAG TPA: hypothetical protein VNF24_02795 [Candidatus Acidoferrales bacterium]|nr:hypothetical protein [Candidatus Acidoferrales bacterium]